MLCIGTVNADTGRIEIVDGGEAWADRLSRLLYRRLAGVGREATTEELHQLVSGVRHGASGVTRADVDRAMASLYLTGVARPRRAREQYSPRSRKVVDRVYWRLASPRERETRPRRRAAGVGV